MARKLRDALGLAAAPAVLEEEVQIIIPDADPTNALVEAAEEGVKAVKTLARDRNSKAAKIANLQQEINYLHLLTVDQREENDRLRRERDLCLHSNTSIKVRVQTVFDIVSRTLADIERTAGAVYDNPPPMHMTNNPDLPQVDANGVPIETPVEKERQFNSDGIPLAVPVNNGGAPVTNLEELKVMIERLNEKHPLSLEGNPT